MNLPPPDGGSIPTPPKPKPGRKTGGSQPAKKAASSASPARHYGTPKWFAEQVLHQLGAPVTRQNVQALVAWEAAEGGNWNNTARYNPLNTTQGMPGDAGTMNSVGVRVYTSWQQGIDATVKTLRNGNYGHIIGALNSGSDAGAVAQAVVSSPWGTHNISLGSAGSYNRGAGATADGAGGGGVTANGNPSLGPSKPLTVRQYLSNPDVSSQYGYLVGYLHDPVVGRILAKAAKNGWDADTLLGALSQTKWWKTHAASQRQWQATKRTDPATARQQLRQEAQTVRSLAASMGFQLDPGRVARIADTALGANWNDQQLREAVGADFHYNPTADYTGTAQSNIASLRQYANDYLVPLSGHTLNQWVQQSLEGRRSPDDFKAYVAEQAKSLFPQLAKMIDAGQTVQQIADPYRQLAGQVLEVDPSAVDFTQPKWRKALDQVNPTSGGRQLMSLTDWQNELMSNPIYGFDKTSNAQQAAADLSGKLLTAMGAG